ncbi:MAG: uncharacterized protein KVP18_000056 [Porospora cf. gigantea A]|uniref:uncharacterized protein n=1 Tax=Porospora cf. gigantea A TaxID=2853593 RepID=UPI00355ABA37|nr:MAG: hypothetical protein KVP18_000056 [Porospora cf. gigantea A]
MHMGAESEFERMGMQPVKERAYVLVHPTSDTDDELIFTNRYGLWWEQAFRRTKCVEERSHANLLCRERRHLRQLFEQWEVTQYEPGLPPQPLTGFFGQEWNRAFTQAEWEAAKLRFSRRMSTWREYRHFEQTLSRDKHSWTQSNESRWASLDTNEPNLACWRRAGPKTLPRAFRTLAEMREWNLYERQQDFRRDWWWVRRGYRNDDRMVDNWSLHLGAFQTPVEFNQAINDVAARTEIWNRNRGALKLIDVDESPGYSFSFDQSRTLRPGGWWIGGHTKKRTSKVLNWEVK